MRTRLRSELERTQEKYVGPFGTDTDEGDHPITRDHPIADI